MKKLLTLFYFQAANQLGEEYYGNDIYEDPSEVDLFEGNTNFKPRRAVVTSFERPTRTSSPHPVQSAKRYSARRASSSSVIRNKRASSSTSEKPDFDTEPIKDEDCLEIENTDYFVGAPERDIYGYTSNIMPSKPRSSVAPPLRPAASWGFSKDDSYRGYDNDPDGST